MRGLGGGLCAASFIDVGDCVFIRICNVFFTLSEVLACTYMCVRTILYYTALASSTKPNKCVDL